MTPSDARPAKDGLANPVPTHPVQTSQYRREGAECPQVVTLSAYEVYRHCYGEQEAIISGGCRGGFGAGELIAFLYAKQFPKDQWRARVDEAMTGMKYL